MARSPMPCPPRTTLRSHVTERGRVLMSNKSNFFESPQAAAVYKHKLLKTDMPAWAGKVGSTSKDERVVVYDAYSGPGR